MTTSNTIVARDLIVDHLTRHGAVRALECSMLSVDGGSSLAVMGTSGCGKSTLLGLLASLALPTRGSVTIGESTISSLSARARVVFRRRELGMIYQTDNLLPFLTIEENVALQLGICADSKSGEQMQPVALLERLGLGGLEKRLPDQLSGGQRQRAAVARAVIHRPAVILADEPTGALDAENARVVIELLVEVHREIGATLVVVTHDPVVAAHLERTIYLTVPAQDRGGVPC